MAQLDGDFAADTLVPALHNGVLDSSAGKRATARERRPASEDFRQQTFLSGRNDDFAFRYWFVRCRRRR
jgi:hypothetical protein